MVDFIWDINSKEAEANSSRDDDVNPRKDDNFIDYEGNTVVTFNLQNYVENKRVEPVVGEKKQENVTESSTMAKPLPEHKMFINFWGDDLRHGFVGEALKKDGVYIDVDELPRGDLTELLVNGIKESRIALVIFSSGYAESSWCLNELLKIKELMERGKLLVIPIFYKVELWEVTQLKGDFGVKFWNLWRINRDSHIVSWKEALESVASMEGIYLKEHSSETEFITFAVNEVLKRVSLWEGENPSLFPSTERGKSTGLPIGTGEKHKTYQNKQHLFGMEHHMEQLEKKLEFDCDKTRIIGVVGMPGIGKTTLAVMLHQKWNSQFIRCVPLLNIRKKSNDYGPVWLRKTLLEVLIEGKFPLISDKTTHESVKDTLLHTKGSKIVISTCDKSLLDGCAHDTYVVPVLNDREAFQLFNYHVFDDKIRSSTNTFLTLSRKFVDYARGHPLALSLLGRELRGKDRDHWEHKLATLTSSNMMFQDVWRFSTDQLNERQKDVFLDIACFFNSEDEYFVRSLLDSGDPDSIDTVSEVRDLANKFLITISDSRIIMNDMMYTFGKDLGSPRWLRLWNYEDFINKSKTMKKSKVNNVRGIFLDMSKLKKSIHLESSIFINMLNLRYLKIYDSCCARKCIPNRKLYLYNGIKFPLKEVRCLHWVQFPLEEIPLDFKPENLVDLRLPYSKIERIWKGVKDTPRLKWVDLSYSRKLLDLSALSKAENLRSLNLGGCTSLNELPVEIQNMKSLAATRRQLPGGERTVVGHGGSGERWSETAARGRNSRWLRRTAVARVFHARAEANLREARAASSGLRLRRGWCLRLRLDERNTMMALDVRDDQWAFIGGGKLNVITAHGCSGDELSGGDGGDSGDSGGGSLQCLSSLPLMNLISLKILILTGCTCTSLQKFQLISESLEVLHLNGTAIKRLPPTIIKLQRLVLLNLKNCKRLESLPNCIGDLKSLKELILSGCSGLKNLSDVRESLKHIQSLLIDRIGAKEMPLISCVSIFKSQASADMVLQPFDPKEWPRGLIGVCSLRRLCLSGNNFVSLQTDIGKLYNLHWLEVKQCKMLTSIPMLPPNLHYFDAHGCDSLERVANPLALPGLLEKEVPAWFSHQAYGSVLKSKLLPHLCDNRFTGIALYARLLYFLAIMSRGIVSCMLDIKKHVEEEDEEECSHTEASFEFQVTDGTEVLEGCEVLKCGSSLVYSTDERTNMSWVAKTGVIAERINNIPGQATYYGNSRSYDDIQYGSYSGPTLGRDENFFSEATFDVTPNSQKSYKNKKVGLLKKESDAGGDFTESSFHDNTSSANVEKIKRHPLVGLEQRLKEIEKVVYSTPGKTRIVGVLGMPGTGKFPSHLFLPMSTECKLEQLRDNVSDKKQLEFLLGDLGWIKKGSKIVITTCDKSLLKGLGHDTYVVPQMNNKEAFQLLTHHAFYNQFRPAETFLTLSRMLVDNVGGNAQDLKVLGSFLSGKNEAYWQYELLRVRQSFNMKMTDIWRFSLDQLNKQQKDVFLDIVYFLKSEEEYFVRSILDRGSHEAVSGVRDLAEKLLITISCGRVEMHDQLYSLANDLGLPGRHKLCNYEDINNLTKQEAKNVRGILLDMSEITESIALERVTFSDMGNLQYLKIYNSCCRRHCRADCNLYFPDGLDFPLEEVRYLHWVKFPLHELPQNFRPESLVDLSLPYSKIERVWEGVKVCLLVPSFAVTSAVFLIGGLSQDTPRLKWVDLRHLLDLSALSRAENLERLNLEGCTSLDELPVEIQNMKSLVYPNMKGCTRLWYLPKMNLVSLKTLILSDCLNLKEFQAISESVEYLHLDGTSMEGLPPAIQNIQRLVVLNLKNGKMCRVPLRWREPMKLVITVLQLGSLGCLVNPTVRSSLLELKFGRARLSVLSRLLNREDVVTHNNRVERERQKRERREKEEKTRQAISRLVLEDQTELDRANILWEASSVSGLEIHQRDLDFNGWIFCCLGFSEAGRHSSSAGQSWFLDAGILVSCGRLVAAGFEALCCSLVVVVACVGSHRVWGTRPLVFPLRRVSFPNKMLEYLPNCLGSLKFLDELIVSGCSRLKNLPDVRNSLKQLQILLFDGTGANEMPSISCFTPDIVKLYNLKLLDVKQCKKLRFVPTLPPRLQFFDAHGCDSLERVANPLALPLLSEQIHAKFNFSNCNKLDEDAKDSIISYSRWRSHHRAFGPVLRSNLPPHWSDNKLTGIALCSVISFPDYHEQRNPLLVKLTDGTKVLEGCEVLKCGFSLYYATDELRIKSTVSGPLEANQYISYSENVTISNVRPESGTEERSPAQRTATSYQPPTTESRVSPHVYGTSDMDPLLSGEPQQYRADLFPAVASSSSQAGLGRSHSQIFVSFHGGDLRRTFVRHLVSTLTDAGISVFTDNDKGNGIKLQNFYKRIEESKIAVAIFSERYIESHFCLDELVAMDKLVRENKLLVIPVFYNVKPSDVKHLKGEFGRRFKEMRVRYKDEAEKVLNEDASLVEATAELVQRALTKIPEVNPKSLGGGNKGVIFATFIFSHFTFHFYKLHSLLLDLLLVVVFVVVCYHLNYFGWRNQKKKWPATTTSPPPLAQSDNIFRKWFGSVVCVPSTKEPRTMRDLPATRISEYSVSSIFSKEEAPIATQLSNSIPDPMARYWNVDFINRTSLNDPMADCCSSSETLPESWQVFINFRGKELRSGFISHLERGLNDAEIKYYVDTKEKILASFSLGSSSPKSLCPSSRAYKLRILPVFFNVAPEEVKEQKGEFGRKLYAEGKRKRPNMPDWENALQSVPSKLEEEDRSISMESLRISHLQRLKLFEDKLDFENCLETQIFGIVGMPGIGKTALADMHFKKWHNRFVFTKNIKAIRSQMFNGKIFLVLDDVSHKNQVNFLLENLEWIKKGSKIVITTRDKSSIAGMVQDTYVVPGLNDKEALELFKHHAFKEKVSSTKGNFPKLSKNYDKLSDQQKDAFLDIACFFRSEEEDYVKCLLDPYGPESGEVVRDLAEKLFICISAGRIEMHNLL
uniref:ADP-ribosyl cyclase/cyclic ADP-ribose hydrolase n=1 Tax=Brassica oleracea var. oleracea TaxID=109376 RepID=A0A0D3AU96_BRAOL